MLLRREGPSVLAIPQQSHAWISGQLARAWGNDLFEAPDPREEVCLAAEQHDIGMATWDLQPAFNPETGLPQSFMEMALEVHLGLWDAAPRRLLAQSRHAALLVSMHGSRLYGRRDLDALPSEQANAVRSYLERQRTFQQQLVGSLRQDAVSAPWVESTPLDRSSRLVWIWDSMSLAVCLDWAPLSVGEAPSVDGPVDLEIMTGPRPRTVVVDPWPFRPGAVAVRCDGRRLDRRVHSEEELRAALAQAPGEVVEFEFLPPYV